MKKRTKILIGSFCAISGLSVIAATCAFCITAKYSNEASSTNATASMPSQSNNANPIATKTNNSSVNSTNNLTKTTTSSSKQASSNSNVNDNGIIKPTPFQNNVSQINAKLAQLKKVTPQLNTTTFTSGLLQYSVNNSNSVTVLGFASGKSTTNLTIPSFVTNDNQFYAVTAVAASAFYDCQLSNVNFNSNLQTIGAMAFADNNLTSLDLPSGLQSIGEKAFISNQFPHAYAVNLGPNTQWSKDWLTCPFSCFDNMNRLQANVQFVIQNTAVYSFQPDQNAWVIVSYVPNTTTDLGTQYKLYANAYDENNWPGASADYTSYTPQSSFTNDTNQYASAYTAPDSLSDYAIWFESMDGKQNNGIIFNPNTMKIDIMNPGEWIFGETTWLTSGGEVYLNIYNPHTNQYIVHSYGNTAIQWSNTLSSLSGVSFQYGDIVWWQVANNVGDEAVYIASNAQDGIGNLNYYYNETTAWTQYQNLITYYVIKPNGIFVTNCGTTVNNLSYNPAKDELTVSGNTVANTDIDVELNVNGTNYNYYTTSNGNGDFTLEQAGINTAVSDSSIVNIYTNGTGVYQSHVQGDNPRNACIHFTCQNYTSTILFDGFTQKLVLSGIDRYFPAYCNEYQTYQNTAPTTSGNFSKSGWMVIEINGTVNKFTYTTSTSIQSFVNWVDSLPYVDGNTYSFYGSDFYIRSVYSNGQETKYGYDVVGSDYVKTFNVSTAGIVCTSMQNYDANSDMDFYNPSGEWSPSPYDQYYNPADAHVGYVDAQSEIMNVAFVGAEETSDEMWNWYNPSNAMVQVVHNITMAYSNPVDQVIAINDWVSKNMDYVWGTDPAPYDVTVNEIFQTLRGVCGDYSALDAAMLKIAGFVSVIVGGNTISQDGNTRGLTPTMQLWNTYTLANSYGYGNDVHAWVKVWIPQYKEWITFDPTWGLNGYVDVLPSSPTSYNMGPIGTGQDYMNMTRNLAYTNIVEWPNGTNYFSYFKGCEYEALYNLGRWVMSPANSFLSHYTSNLAGGLIKILENASSLPNSNYRSYINDPSYNFDFVNQSNIQ